ncbi:MAG: Gfo/Idh/MocA family oxidoreductase [Bryobacteraceae bacterium]|nr:Gfo/Idh/MocA family oxidoreductase [Bryobacterales bacterium]MEB2361128.1 Gfo/Idh/MocA family oxidoreductase [Bryobacterales bacterium]NUN02210.1 Gfo/Idh/MocA family oxidoreductase [Bryobacteraceae bacterium]
MKKKHEAGASRRKFLKTATGAVSALPIGASAYAQGSGIIRVGVIGCGGRGTEAATQAMHADKGVRIAAMADLLMERAQEKRNLIRVRYPDQVTADDAHCFSGFDGYKNVIESVDVVIIANAAKFHPLHMMAAIEAGKHVFVEKPHAIDPAGSKVVRAACDLAKKKNLCVVSGLQSRYHPGYRETIQRIHDGAIGDIIAVEENFLRAPYVLYPRKPGLSEVEWQGSNQYHFHWLCGDDVPQSLIHNLDRASWALHNAAPLKCHGMGGRSTLRGEIYGSVFDHHAVVYEFASGVRIYAFCRTIPDCYNENSSIILGSKGRCNVTRMTIEGETKWQYTGPRTYSSPTSNPYFIEHAELFKAIRSGRAINNGDYMVRSTLIANMGQISCYTGKEVTWDQISTSDFYFAPKPEDVRPDMEAPVKPDAEGNYPVFIPGVTKLLTA